MPEDSGLNRVQVVKSFDKIFLRGLSDINKLRQVVAYFLSCGGLESGVTASEPFLFLGVPEDRNLAPAHPLATPASHPRRGLCTLGDALWPADEEPSDEDLAA